MKNLSPEFCRRIGQARRDADISQSELAAELGCKQPALSMFEAGDGTKLSDEIVKKLSERFGIPFSAETAALKGRALASPVLDGAELRPLGYCPNCQCPSNVPYVVGERLFLRPSFRLAAPVPSARRCAMCGEVLELRCPGCGAPLNEGACCAVCGLPYVTPALSPGLNIHSWAHSRRDEIAALRALS